MHAALCCAVLCHECWEGRQTECSQRLLTPFTLPLLSTRTTGLGAHGRRLLHAPWRPPLDLRNVRCPGLLLQQAVCLPPPPAAPPHHRRAARPPSLPPFSCSFSSCSQVRLLVRLRRRRRVAPGAPHRHALPRLRGGGCVQSGHEGGRFGGASAPRPAAAAPVHVLLLPAIPASSPPRSPSCLLLPLPPPPLCPTAEPPKVIHYGLLWNVPGTDYSFDKHWHYQFNPLVCPPWDIG